jgi:hypothetical protein
MCARYHLDMHVLCGCVGTRVYVVRKRERACVRACMCV